MMYSSCIHCLLLALLLDCNDRFSMPFISGIVLTKTQAIVGGSIAGFLVLLILILTLIC
ncbi:hypothetical protein BT96DRAFT_1027681 [Gymnopus androsaceus JB14]|uniref:Uncharacterized protein n=1 Tax=Gymnopus androsaceus JB14 TaxID=1447944 RepID=A0A6A4GA66_9AGAR|nr:hypothetical protein BT96DRAFT_1027681 [Gymnopus androsaceus JB14]